jgi:branched-chain amino acid transport system substrate-binding protein
MIAAMRATPPDDVIFGKSIIRMDGRVIHPIYLLEAKKPSESTGGWDLLKPIATIPIDQAFRPMNAGLCPMIHA